MSKAYDEYLRKEAERQAASQNQQALENRQNAEMAKLKQINNDASKMAQQSQSIKNMGNANTGYDWTRYIGNTNDMYNAMKNAGYVTNGNAASNFTDSASANLASYNANRYSSGYSPSYISASSLSRIGQFQPSQAYLDAMSYTQSLLDKLNTGRTSYSDRVDAMMNKIANRDAFSYDFNTDPLFQNMLSGAMSAGQTAMQDTIGQASALTGGYGSSYATSAGNQAYNNFVQDAYAQLPEYYKLALDAYTREGDEMYRQLGMYSDADDREYGRLSNAYGLNYQKAQDMYGQEYSNYWDTANYNFNVDKYNADAAMDAAQFNAQQAYNAAKFEYEKQQDALTRADNLASSASNAEEMGASSADFQKALSMYEDVVKQYGDDSQQTYEQGARIAKMFNLSEEQTSTMVNQGGAYYTPTPQLKETDSVPILRDQTGKPLTNYAASFTEWENIDKEHKAGDGTLTKQYTDTSKFKNKETGQIYTYAQLKALGWDKYIK